MSHYIGYAAQLAYESEGAIAGLQGKRREDCPYDETINPGGWNHWVYGCEIAAGEQETIKAGVVSFINEHGIEVFHMPVAEAIESGRWKPRFAKIEIPQ